MLAPRTVAGYDAQLVPPAIARVWVGEGRPHETIAVPGVTLAPGEVLVRIELATVCGSDVHTVAGHRTGPAPSVLGHEYVGRVVAIGDDGVCATDGGVLHVGDRVVWSIFAACGECDRCDRGIPQKCRSVRKYGHERLAPRWELGGGFSTHAHLLAGTAIVRVRDRVPAAVAAPAACGAATAWAAVDAAAQSVQLDGAVMLVLGAGLIGLTASAMAAARGARVVVVDPDAGRRALALEFGAAAAVAPAPVALQDALRDLDACEPLAVIEASGARAAVAQAVSTAAVGGVVVLVGSVFPTEPVDLDPELLVRRCLTLRGVHNYPPAALVEAVRFLEAGFERHPFAALVGSVHPLSDLDAAIAAASVPGAPVRIGIDPRS